MRLDNSSWLPIADTFGRRSSAKNQEAEMPGSFDGSFPGLPQFPALPHSRTQDSTPMAILP